MEKAESGWKEVSTFICTSKEEFQDTISEKSKLQNNIC